MPRVLMDPAAVLAAPLTLSDKIRKLAAAGYSRRQIADLVDRSYQQVRQVLVEDERRAKRSGPAQQGVAERPATSLSAPAAKGVYRLPYSADGEISVPEDLEKALGLYRTGIAVAEFDGECLRILSSAAALKRAQDYVRSLNIPKGVSLADELIADRRREAEQEERDG
jgi:hypothetical protein